MRTFRACFKLQLRLLTAKRALFLGIIYLLAAGYLVQDGSSIYKDIIKDKDQFVQVEKKKVDKFKDYVQYANFGFKIKFVSSPLSIFFYKSGYFSNLCSELDVGERLNINMSLKGNYMFDSQPSIPSDFNGILLLFGSLMVMILGLTALRTVDFLKTSASLTPRKRIYHPMVISRFFVLHLYFFLAFVLGIVIVLLNGIHFAGRDYLVMAIYYAAWLVISGVLYWIGCTIGQFSRKESAGLLPVFLAWIILAFGASMAVNKLTMEKAKAITPNHQMELKKWEYLMNFEERAKNMVKSYSKGPKKTIEEIDLVESFFNIEYKQVMGVEQDVEEVTKRIIDYYHRISSLTPLTFLNDISGDIGSKGYENGLMFMKYSEKMKDDYCNFIKQKRFQSDEPKDKKIESFIKSEENVYYGKSRLKGNFSFVIFLYCLLLTGLILVSYYRFKYASYRLNPREIKDLETELENKKINIKKGETLGIDTESPLVKNLLFSLLAGKNEEAREKGLIDTVLLNNRDIVKEKNTDDFLYICPFHALPQELTVGSIISFFADLKGFTRLQKSEFFKSRNLQPLLRKRTDILKAGERIQVLTAISHLKSCAVYMFYETVTGMTAKKAWEFVKELKEFEANGAAVIYISTSLSLSNYITNGNEFILCPKWGEEVERIGKNYEVK